VPSETPGTIQQLASILGQYQGEIMDEWRTQAAKLLRDLDLDHRTITDHLPDIVAEIIKDLAMSRDGDISTEHTRGSPPAHGVQRFHDGLDLGEVVAEYNLLRDAFTTVAERYQHPITGEAARIINHRLDEAVRLAVMAFASQQELIRKEQDDDHLAFIAHDLRTPLNAISLVMEEIREGLDPESLAKVEDLFEIVTRNLHRMGGLVNKVLEASMHPPGAGSSFRPERRLFDLWPLVQRLVIDLRPVAEQQGIEVVSDIPRTLTVFGDAGLVSQVFQNLLGNAFKYTPQGRVILRAMEGDEVVTCTVEDNGEGIPQEMLTKIFDKQVTDPGKDGTGLGLTIVRQIIAAHGGVVKAESTPGAGARFTFTLPCAAAAVPTEAEAEAEAKAEG
jgi:signal transduction histidine kinase